jgi:predicted nucleotidyltransferase
MLHKETVSKEMWELLQKLMKEERLKDFILVGGTALSLMLGHRLSIDIDLFTTKSFNEQSILNYLLNNYPVEVKNTFENTLL